MPSIYKASSVTLKDNAVAIDIGDTLNIEPNTAAIPADGTENEYNTDYGKSEEDLLTSARNEADLILQNARAEAKLIKDSTKRETDRLRSEILENARSQGYEEGYNKSLAEGEPIKREAEQILSETYAEREAIINNMEPKMVNLIIKILNKLLGDYVRINPQIILKLIREGLSAVVGTEGVKLRVSPEDYDFIHGNFEQITEYAGSNSVELVRDASLKPMDCVIETAYGNIDSSLDQQFESLKADLLYTLNSAEA